MNKNKIFDADGQADTDSIERSEKRSSQIYDKNLCKDTNVLIQAPYAIKRL